MRMRQSLAEIEEAFVDEIEEDRHRRERLRAEAERRTQVRRHSTRTQQAGHGPLLALVLTLIATAVIVTIAMFQTLYYRDGLSAQPFELSRFRASSTSARADAPAATFSCWISR